MDKKIMNAVYALYGGAIATAVNSVLNYLQFQKYNFGIEMGPNLNPTWLLSFATFPLLIAAAAYFIAKDLKSKNKWSWMLALSFFVINFSGVAILFSVYGTIQLCDREVREHFLKQMDMNIE